MNNVKVGLLDGIINVLCLLTLVRITEIGLILVILYLVNVRRDVLEYQKAAYQEAFWKTKTHVLEYQEACLEYQEAFWNIKKPFRIQGRMFGTPRCLFGIPRCLLEYQDAYLEYQEAFWNTKKHFGIPRRIFGIPRSL